MKAKILEMALNFLESSVDYIKEDKSSGVELQFSTIHLAASIELMLKACLIKEHWSLVINDLKDMNLSKFESGNFKSIGIDEAALRVRNICRCNIDKKIIDRIKNERNKIIHIGSSVNQYQATANIVDSYSFIYDFTKEAALFEPESEHKHRFGEIKEKINTLQNFVANRLRHISNELKRHENVIRCPECWQNSVVFSEEKRSCLFCRTEFELEIFIEQYGDAFLSHDDIGIDFSACPNCGESSAVFAEEINSTICLFCNSNLNEYLRCIDCG